MSKFSGQLLLAAIIFQGCAGSENLWVAGVKSTGTAGAGKMETLNVSRNSDPEELAWENFYSPIEGFSFEEGYLKKIKVKVKKLNPENVPADASSLKYTFVSELEKMADPRANLSGSWILASLAGAPLNRSIVLPGLNIDLKQKLISGNAGCNNYTATIKNISTKFISISPVAGTRKACIENNVESEYYKALDAVRSYAVSGNDLALFDESGKTVAAFLKKMK